MKNVPKNKRRINMLRDEEKRKLTNYNGENSNAILSTLKFNGKSKSIDDFNVLEDYYSRFCEQPHTVQIIHDDAQFFRLDTIKREIKSLFPKSKLIYRDSYFDVKTNQDSIAPVLKFLKEDMVRLIETLNWE
jgi:hypothetical protein